MSGLPEILRISPRIAVFSKSNAFCRRNQISTSGFTLGAGVRMPAVRGSLEVADSASELTITETSSGCYSNVENVALSAGRAFGEEIAQRSLKFL